MGDYSRNTGRQPSERREKIQNSPSKLLNNDENELIFSFVGNKCVTLSTAVVQVFLADQTSGNSRRWNKRCTGILTFIKDNENKSYYLRVYSLKHRTIEWQQEIYSQFRYKEPRDQFHTFEADTCSAGLSFANIDEAKHFAQVVNGKIQERLDRRRTKRKQTQHKRPGGPGAAPAPMSISGPQSSLPITPAPSPAIITPTKPNKNNKMAKAKPKKITKEDISVPSDFRHVNHIGWHPNSGFDINNLDSDMKSLFDMAGISNEILEDDDMRQQIYDVIESQGGMDAVKQQMNHRTPAPSPAPPPPPSHGARGGHSKELPPPPPRHGGVAPAPPPPPSRHLPAVPHSGPPPPAIPSSAPPPPTPNRNNRHRGMGAPPPPPPPSGRTGAGLPPPPPPSSHHRSPPPPAGVPAPPPPPSGGPPPPPPPSGGPPPPPPPPSGGMGNALLSDIHSGRKLNKVTQQAPAAAPAVGRDALLSAIKGGSKLKHVDPSKADNSPPPSEASSGGGGNLLNALMSVMSARNQAINPSDDSDDDDDDDDDDWEDDD